MSTPYPVLNSCTNCTTETASNITTIASNSTTKVFSDTGPGSFTSLLNTFGNAYLKDSKPFLSYSHNMAIGLVGIILNICALVLLLKVSKKGKTPSDMFLLSQVGSDLGSSAMSFFWPFGMAFYPKRFYENLFMRSVCNIWYSQFLMSILMNTSVFTCSLLTLDRYAKIVFPFSYKTSMTNNKAYFMIAVLILFSTLHSYLFHVVPNQLTNGYCVWGPAVSRQYRMAILTFDLIITNLIPLAIFMWCYGHMLAFLRRRSKIIRPIAIAMNLTQMATNGSSKTTSKKDLNTTNNGFEINQNRRTTTNKINSHPLSNPSDSRSLTMSTANHKPKQVKNSNHILSRAERNVLITALMLNISFIVTNAPLRIYIFLLIFRFIQRIQGAGFQLMVAILYVNYCMHPIIFVFSLAKVRAKLLFWKK